MSVSRKLGPAATLVFGLIGHGVLAQPAPMLQVHALPEHVHPAPGRSQWSARVLVTIGAASAVDVPIHLAADSPAVLATPYVVIPAGRTAVDVEVTATRKGDASVYAWGNEGTLVAETTISFHLAAARLTLHVSPTRSLAIGGAAAVNLTVALTDETNVPCAAERETPVALTAPFGTLSGDVRIPAGAFAQTVRLSSLRRGRGRVTAQADGLTPAEAEVEFEFPWTIVGVAMLGGALGSLYRSGARSWHSSAAAALPGLLFGLVVYALVAFVPPAELPDVVKPLATLPVTSGLGAVVLGIAGGYCGRRVLPDTKPRAEKRAATV